MFRVRLLISILVLQCPTDRSVQNGVPCEDNVKVCIPNHTFIFLCFTIECVFYKDYVTFVKFCHHDQVKFNIN